MKLLLQRVSQASVTVEGKVVSSIDDGYLMYLGVFVGDIKEQATWLAKKVLSLKIFESESGPQDVTARKGSVLVVSQFTLAAGVANGTKPDYSKAAKGAEAEPLYHVFIEALREGGVAVETGVFGATMRVMSINEGPYTLILDH